MLNKNGYFCYSLIPIATLSPRISFQKYPIYKVKTRHLVQGLTLRSERHLPVGQVKVMFYLPSAHGHLPPKIYFALVFILTFIKGTK